MTSYYINILWNKINIFKEKLIFQKGRAKTENAEKYLKIIGKKLYKNLFSINV